MKSTIKEGRLNKIIDFAEDIFLEKGYAKASISDICKRANCSRTTLYHHFESKENVYLAVVHKSFKIFLDYFLELSLDGESGKSKMMRLAEGYLQFAQTHPKPYSLILDFYSLLKDIQQEEDQSDMVQLLSKASYFERVQKQATYPANYLIRIIETGQGDGSIQQDTSAETLFLNVWALLIGSSSLFNFSNTGRKGNYLGLKAQISPAEVAKLVGKILS